MLKKIISYFIPSFNIRDTEQQRRIRLVAYSVAIAAFFSLFYVVVSFICGFYPGSIIMLISFICCIILLFLLKSGLLISELVYKESHLFFVKERNEQIFILAKLLNLCQYGFHQIFQVEKHLVFEFLLQLVPKQFHRIQFRTVTWQRDKVHSARPACQEILNLLASMDAGSVPYYQQVLAAVPATQIV